MIAKDFDMTTDYNDIFNWWQMHNWSPVQPLSLPVTGIMVSSDKQKICAGFLYKTDSELCFMEFFISNPETSKEERNIGLDLLIEALTKKAKLFGYKTIVSALSNHSLMNRAEKHDFVIVGENITSIARRIE